MTSEPDRPLFAHVGRDSGRATDPRSRTFHLVIVVGLLVAAGLLVTELGEHGRWTTVRVTLEGPELDPEVAPVIVPVAP